MKEKGTNVVGLESLQSTGKIDEELLHLESSESDGDGLGEKRLRRKKTNREVSSVESRRVETDHLVLILLSTLTINRRW